MLILLVVGILNAGHLGTLGRMCDQQPWPASRWRCRGQTEDARFQRFDCGWVGNWIRPGGMRPRSASEITPMNRDEWVDSVELAQVLI